MNKFCDKQPFEVSWYLKNIKTGEITNRNGDSIVSSASVRKIAILMAALKAVYDGKVSLNKPVTIKKKYQKNHSGCLRFLKPGFTITFQDALTLMIIISDNTCTGHIVDILGINYINEYNKSIGLKNTKIIRGFPPIGLVKTLDAPSRARSAFCQKELVMHDFFGALGTTNQYPNYQRTREMSLTDMLLENRIIFLAGPIMEKTANVVIQQLLYLQSIRRNQDVNLYINSPGGLVDQTLAIYDTMQFMGCEIATYCIGQAASGAAIILLAGTKGKRFILPNAKVMLHQPYGGITGQAEDIRIQAEEVLRDKARLNRIIAKCTNKSEEDVAADTERDRFLNAEEALEYGIVDEILEDAPNKDESPTKKSGKK